MLAHTPPTPTTVGDIPAMQLAVLRCTSTAERWGATPRFHAPGRSRHVEPAVRDLRVQQDDDRRRRLLVHRVDEHQSPRLLLRRRGQRLHDSRAAPCRPDNPPRDLRRALWAEHLGLPDAMGRALLSDPIAAFDLFRRPAFSGNRFRPFSAIDVAAYLSIPTTDGALGQLLRIALLNYVNELVPVIWNDSSDPTTTLDPQPVPGP